MLYVVVVYEGPQKGAAHKLVVEETELPLFFLTQWTGQ